MAARQKSRDLGPIPWTSQKLYDLGSLRAPMLRINRIHDAVQIQKGCVLGLAWEDGEIDGRNALVCPRSRFPPPKAARDRSTRLRGGVPSIGPMLSAVCLMIGNWLLRVDDLWGFRLRRRAREDLPWFLEGFHTQSWLDQKLRWSHFSGCGPGFRAPFHQEVGQMLLCPYELAIAIVWITIPGCSVTQISGYL
jgi:hypothetical protein